MAETLPSTTYQEVVRWLSDRTGVREEQIGPSTLLRDLVEDSLEFVEVVMAFEDEHGVDLQNPTTPLENTADLVHYVENLRAARV